MQVVIGPIGLPIPIASTTTAEQNKALAKSLARALRRDENESTYQTCARFNPKTGQCYSGRTSGYGTPEDNVRARSAQQATLSAEGFEPGILDASSKNYSPIRGREQQIIDINGSAKSDGGYARNAIRGVSRLNPFAPYYEASAINEFGGPSPSGSCTCSK